MTANTEVFKEHIADIVEDAITFAHEQRLQYFKEEVEEDEIKEFIAEALEEWDLHYTREEAIEHILECRLETCIDLAEEGIAINTYNLTPFTSVTKPAFGETK